ncbi:kinase-like domain-containing protein, partial [Copromyces sp. CBS 386.78]
EIWEERERVGKGGQGSVYLHVCLEGKNPAAKGTMRAVKKSQIQCIDGDPYYYRRELMALRVLGNESKFRHHFVSFYGWFKTKDFVYVTMEFLKDGSLESYLGDTKVLRESECKQVAEQVLKALKIMHRAGFAHRDLNPRNILISQMPTSRFGPQIWRIKLADFGLTKRIESGDGQISTVKGSPDYQPPEVDLMGRYPPTMNNTAFFRMDMWALGITTYYLLCHKYPFQSHAEKLTFIQGGEDHRRISQIHRDTLTRGTITVTPEGQQFISELLIAAEKRKLPDECRKHAWFKEY